MTNYTGNISTIIKLISMTIAGWFIGILASHGLELGVDTTTLSQVIGAIILLILGLIDAKYPNTLNIFDNNDPSIESENEYTMDVEDNDI